MMRYSHGAPLERGNTGYVAFYRKHVDPLD